MLPLKILTAPFTSCLLASRKHSNLWDEAEENKDLLYQKYVHSIPGAQKFKGVLLQGFLISQWSLKNADTFDIREDDVFIASYPKSGTTWTEEILSLICNNGDMNKVKKKLLNERVIHYEIGKPLLHKRDLLKHHSPRLIATHLPLFITPKQLREGKCKVIYVARNPKDNAVSFYHYHRMSKFLGNFSGTWAEFLNLFMKGQLVYGSWFDHVLQFWEHSQQNHNVLFIKYEDMKKDLAGTIQQIAMFVGRPLNDETIEKIAFHCSFEQMKNNTMVNREVLPLDVFDMSVSKFMRKGIVGDWVNHFSDEQNEEFDKLYVERLKGTGLEFEFSVPDKPTIPNFETSL